MVGVDCVLLMRERVTVKVNLVLTKLLLIAVLGSIGLVGVGMVSGKLVLLVALITALAILVVATYKPTSRRW